MKLINGVMVLVAMVVLAATVGAAAKRIVRMQIAVPNGAAPQITVYEGETATIQMKGDTKYGFVPSLAQGSETVVEIAIFDLSATPNKQLDAVEVTVGGDAVKSKTSPAFSVRVLDIKPQ